MAKTENRELREAIRTLSKFLYVVTDEPSRFIRWLADNFGSKDKHHINVWRPTLGVKPITDYVGLWENFNTSALALDQSTAEPNVFLASVLAQETPWEMYYTVMLGADVVLSGQNPMLTRRLFDLAEQLHQNRDSFKSVIFVGHRLRIPPGMDRMFEVCHFELPTVADHKAMVEEIINNEQISASIRRDVDVDAVAQAMAGMTHYEADQAVLSSLALRRGLTAEVILETKRRIIKKNPLLELVEPSITFDDVGGMENLKAYLQARKGSWTPEAKEFGLGRFRGVLQVGLPGNGKSLACKAVASSYGLPLVKFDPARLFSGQVGSSESNMHRALDTLEKMAPCLVWIDEIEKGLAGMQSSSFSDSGTTARVIGSFLNWMQECEEDVILMATANDVQNLPPELLRRFNDIFFVGLPDKTQRREIWGIHIRAKGRDPSEFDIVRLIEASQDRSGAEIEMAVDEGLVTAFNDGLRDLTTEDLVTAVEAKPPLLVTMREQLQEIIEWVGRDENTNQGIRARFAHADEPDVAMTVS